MIELDGNYGEGGGQIVRTALALSCLTKKPFKVTDIRKGRVPSGLKAQHLKCIEILKELTDAFVENDFLGSESITFAPRKAIIKNINADIGTAGSITLLLQSILPFLIFQKKRVKVKITGGTDVPWSMPYDYFANVIIPQLRRFANIECNLLRRGYYPQGNGEIELSIKPKEFKSMDITAQGELVQIKGIASSSKSLENRDVAERMANASKHILTRLNVPVNISPQYNETSSDGCGITLFAIFSEKGETTLNPKILGADIMGEKRKTSEEIGIEAAEKLLKEIESKAPVDEHTADNLIPFMAIAGGKIKVSNISKHTLTNVYVTEKFLDVKFEIENNVIKVSPAECLSEAPLNSN